MKIEVDTSLLNEALALSPGKTIEAVVREALTEYICVRKQQKILELFGQIEYDPDYQYKSERQRTDN